MDFIVESFAYAVSDKGRIYRIYKTKPGGFQLLIRIGTVRSESNAPINSVGIEKFNEISSIDLIQLGMLFKAYVSIVHEDKALIFLPRNVGIVEIDREPSNLNQLEQAKYFSYPNQFN